MYSQQQQYGPQQGFGQQMGGMGGQFPQQQMYGQQQPFGMGGQMGMVPGMGMMGAAPMGMGMGGGMAQQQKPDTTTRKVFVGGLPYHTDDAALKDYFSKYGEIDEAVVIMDRATGKSKGYGFVTFMTEQGANDACENPNPYIDGRKANVNMAFKGAKPRVQDQQQALYNQQLQQMQQMQQMYGAYGQQWPGAYGQQQFGQQGAQGMPQQQQFGQYGGYGQQAFGGQSLEQQAQQQYGTAAGADTNATGNMGNMSMGNAAVGMGAVNPMGSGMPQQAQQTFQAPGSYY